MQKPGKKDTRQHKLPGKGVEQLEKETLRQRLGLKLQVSPGKQVKIF